MATGLAKLDHLAVAAERLEDGVADVEIALGVPLAPGGKHPAMGTHNRLLGLGPDQYLEVIAIDPAAPPPGRPRWFDLDKFAGRPRLTNWIARCDDLDAVLGEAPDGAGEPLRLSRGDLSWRIAVPRDGHLPYQGCFPALIEWSTGTHPSERLPDSGCRLVALEIVHPSADALAEALARVVDDPRVYVVDGPAPALIATIDTPHGRRVLA